VRGEVFFARGRNVATGNETDAHARRGHHLRHGRVRVEAETVGLVVVVVANHGRFFFLLLVLLLTDEVDDDAGEQEEGPLEI
jgi:hypothetical protein